VWSSGAQLAAVKGDDGAGLQLGSDRVEVAEQRPSDVVCGELIRGANDERGFGQLADGQQWLELGVVGDDDAGAGVAGTVIGGLVSIPGS
jgi:hypothetical protein